MERPFHHFSTMSSTSSPTIKISGKEFTTAFFHRETPDGSVWVCRCGKKCQQKGGGYANLVSHIVQSHHGEYREVLAKKIEATPRIKDSLWPQKARNLHRWLSLIVDGIVPISLCENETELQAMKLDSVARPTLINYIDKLSTVVERKIADKLPMKFALVLDGWTSEDVTNYFAVFATFPDTTELGYSRVLLKMSSEEDEGCLVTAQEQYDFVTQVLGVYLKSWKSVICVILDDNSNNKAFAELASRPLVICAYGRFNFAVQNIMTDYTHLTFSLFDIMKKLENFIPATKLKELTPLPPFCEIACRWTSAHEMLLRYNELKELIPQSKMREIEEIMPDNRQNRDIQMLLCLLADFQVVAKALQKDDTTMLDVRDLFDEVLKKHQEMSSRLGADASIIFSKTFESAIQKILKGSEKDLTPRESIKVRRLRLQRSTVAETTTEGEQEVEDAAPSLVERALKRQRVASTNSTSDFMDLRFIVPTSELCERLFSEDGHQLNNRWESQMFLRSNKTFWGIADINDLIKKNNEVEDNENGGE